MFYGAFVLGKKGPLAKVWLAAHWDKKLTKAHVFETDVGSTVDSIISPQVKMALRTSGHLLLGVVRIYSRKQKYLLQDLGEACAKIKMAFRPGIVDLPSDGGAENADAITLPEIFHDFENAVADLGALDIEAQFTINPNRASEITMPEDVTTTGGVDIFGGEFDSFDLKGGDFGGGMEDIEVPRNAQDANFGDERDITEKSNVQISGLSGGTFNGDSSTRMRSDSTLEERGLPDAANDFGFDGFGLMDGEFGDFGELPPVPDLTVDGEGQDKETEETAPKITGNQDEETAMEVDPPGENQQPDNQNAVSGDDTGVVPAQEESGFLLEPVEITGVEEKRSKRKRRLVVDNDKEFTGKQIKSQFEDFKDLLQPKCFPPPTKKAMMWKELAACEQLYSNPATPTLATEFIRMVTRNYNVDIPCELAPETQNELDIPGEQETGEQAAETLNELDIPGEMAPETLNELVSGELAPETLNEFDMPGESALETLNEIDMPGEPELETLENITKDSKDPSEELDDLQEDTKVLPNILELDLPTQEQQSNESSEEFEQRRWTKRTQQVLRVIQRGLSKSDEVQLSSLNLNCTRKQAASCFYTCLLLAKEGMVSVRQDKPYGEIHLQKGSKFTEVA